jgi:hypothetical protein
MTTIITKVQGPVLDYGNTLSRQLEPLIESLYGHNQEEINFGYEWRVRPQHYYKLMQLGKTNEEISAILSKGTFEQPLEVDLNSLFTLFMLDESGKFTSSSRLKHTSGDDMIGGRYFDSVYYMRDFSVGTYTVHGHTGLGRPLFVEILKSLKNTGVESIAIQNIITNSRAWWTKLGFTLIPMVSDPNCCNLDTKVESIDHIIELNSSY